METTFIRSSYFLSFVAKQSASPLFLSSSKLEYSLEGSGKPFVGSNSGTSEARLPPELYGYLEDKGIQN